MSKADGRPAYSEHGLENRPLFFAGCNNVNIYVEDTDKEYVYEQILERLFENGLRFQSIFPLNGKQAVLARCRINGAYEPDGTPNIYIVDACVVGETRWKPSSIIVNGRIGSLRRQPPCLSCLL